MTTTTTTTKRTTPAKAKAKGEASVKAAAAALAEQPDAASALRILSAAAQTPAEYRAAAKASVAFVTDAEADAFEALLIGRRLTAENLYGEYRATLLLADANASVKPAAEVGFTAVASQVFSLTKDGFEALSAAKRPLRRSWSALAEDWRLFVQTSGDTWREGYDLSRQVTDTEGNILSVSVPTCRDYLTFATRANEQQAKATGEDGAESAQAKGARTKAERAAQAKAEAERQAKAKADAQTKRETDAQKAEQAKADAATLILRHVSEHPHANLIAGVSLTCADASALSVSTLRGLAHACEVLAADAERRTAEAAKAAKDGAAAPSAAEQVAAGQAAAEAALATHGTEAEAAALGAAAEAAAPSLGDLLSRNPAAADLLADLLSKLTAS